MRRARAARSAGAVLAWATVLALASSCQPSEPRPSRVELDAHQPVTAPMLAAAGWRTDVDHAVVLLCELRMGPVSREAFQPIRAPRFGRAADSNLPSAEPVLVVRTGDGVRAWPLVHLLRRELACDIVAGVPVAVTFCSLCGAARVWDRRLDGAVLELAVSGMLMHGNALLYDADTESLWRQLDGLAVVGAHAGRRLRALPAFTVSFGALLAAHPDALVMRPPEAGRDPPLQLIAGADVSEGVPPPWLHTSCPDPLAWTLDVDGDARPSVVIRDPDTAAPFPVDGGTSGPVVGSSAAFGVMVDGRALSFEPLPGGARDRETGSRWNALGEAVDGPLRGRCLEPLPQVVAFRFVLDADGP